MIEYFYLFIILMFGHALADFGLQTEFVGKYKFRKYAKELPKEQNLNQVWIYCLINHAMIHGFFVWFFTKSILLGILETVAHAIIDFLKCEGIIELHTDQWLHVACKIFYVIAIYFYFN